MINMLAFLLVCIGVFSRLLPHMSQFTAILAIGMFGGMYLPRRQAIIVPVAVMMVSDVFLGFHDTMFFTWGSMVVVSLIGFVLRDRKNWMTVLGGSILSALVFFVVTNFGAWLSLYPRTFEGFTQCYIAAIPFFRTTLASTVAYSLVLYFGYEWIVKRCQGTSLARMF